MTSEIIFEVTEDEAEGGLVARALGYSIVTQADSAEELRANVREAVRCHFEEGGAPALRRPQCARIQSFKDWKAVFWIIRGRFEALGND